MTEEPQTEYDEAAREVYRKSTWATQQNAIAAAILVLAEAIKYHADVTLGTGEPIRAD